MWGAIPLGGAGGGTAVSLAFLVCVLLDKIELLAVMTGRFDL